ncbi:pyridoxamine 5'-phosphate oxidase family protein [Mycobacterium sp. 050128]|uniref:pyridoxamine 5'-phosphate oxidase family protein n=1 Tax=Mycobacterium sp. 050128 TaxID=3096112 RepID=UPI002ED96EB3
MSSPIPASIRVLIDGPNYAHLSTVSAGGHPRNWVVWVAREDDNVLICTHAKAPKAKDMRRDPRVGLSITAFDNPYRMAALQGRVIAVRDDAACHYMDPISIKYTGAAFPSRGPGRVCFVIAIDNANQHTLDFTHNPTEAGRAPQPKQHIGARHIEVRCGPSGKGPGPNVVDDDDAGVDPPAPQRTPRPAHYEPTRRVNARRHRIDRRRWASARPT